MPNALRHYTRAKQLRSFFHDASYHLSVKDFLYAIPRYLYPYRIRKNALGPRLAVREKLRMLFGDKTVFNHCLPELVPGIPLERHMKGRSHTESVCIFHILPQERPNSKKRIRRKNPWSNKCAFTALLTSIGEQKTCRSRNHPAEAWRRFTGNRACWPKRGIACRRMDSLQFHLDEKTGPPGNGGPAKYKWELPGKIVHCLPIDSEE